MESINPATGERIRHIATWDDAVLERTLGDAAAAVPGWQATSFAERGQLLRRAAAELRTHLDEYARLITLEMGKLYKEARAEVEKCASGCDYFAEHAPAFLRDEP